MNTSTVVPFAGLRNLSIAAFFVVLSVCLAVITFSVLPGLQQSQHAQAQAYQDVGRAIRETAAQFAAGEAARTEQLKRLGQQASQGSVLLEESAILVGARFLESEQLLPSATANEMAREAIYNIKQKYSPRVARLLEALNDQYLKQR